MRSPITSAIDTTAVSSRDSTTRPRCSSVAAMESSTCPICSSAFFWIWKVTAYLQILSADTTRYGIFHGKSQRTSLLIVLFSPAWVFAHGGGMHLMGTVADVDAQHVVVKTKDGKTQSVLVN